MQGGIYMNELMSKLSFAAYCYPHGNNPAQMKSIIQGVLNIFVRRQKIVWGAVSEEEDLFGFNTALVYIVQNTRNPREYTVVVRGTNPFSIIKSIIQQDFMVWNKVRWTQQSPLSAAKDAWISEAANNSLNIHRKLNDGGKTIFDFLKEKSMQKDIIINFTGHSLGGLLAPTLALLFYELHGKELSDSGASINVYSFAGPTAGDGPFARHTESVFMDEKSPFKSYLFYRNSQDIAVKISNTVDMLEVFGFYKNAPMNLILKMLWGSFWGVVYGLDYTQPFHNDGKTVASDMTALEEILNTWDLEDIDLEAELGIVGKGLSEKLSSMPVSKEESTAIAAGTLKWFAVVLYQHIIPYLRILPEEEDRNYIKNNIIKPLIKDSFPGEKLFGMLEKI